MSLTQNLSMCERVHATRTRGQRPRPPAQRMSAPITVLAMPASVDVVPVGSPAFIAIPYAPKRRQVAHFQRQSCFVTEAAIAARQEQRVQRRTDDLMRRLVPYVGKDGQVVRGAWQKLPEID